jgi:hypothetical protein
MNDVSKSQPISIAKQFAVAAIGLAALIAIVGGGFFTLMAHHFHPPAPRPNFPPATGGLEAQRQDIRYFRESIALDRSFSLTAREEANRRLDMLERHLTVFDAPHFRISLMRIDALSDNGHSRVEDDGHARSLELPIHVAAFSDGLYIMRAKEGYADLLGGRVIAIDGQAINDVMAKLEQLRGGTHQWRSLLASQYLTLQELLYGIDVARDMEHSDWTVDTPAGIVTRTLDAIAPSGSESLPVTRWLSSERLTGREETWLSVEPDHALPLSLRDFDTAFRSLPIPGTCTRFVQLKSNADRGGLSIRAFLSDTQRQLQRVPPCNVVLDLRYDSGGDYLNTYHFARHLPSLIPEQGRIFVLTGPTTFSAGITTIAFIKHVDPRRVVILGEPVGDRLQFFSEGGRACLPNHALCVVYETGKHDYQHACTDWDVCFWLNFFFSMRVTSLDPDEAIPWSFKEWRTGVDPVLERAIALAMTNRRS